MQIADKAFVLFWTAVAGVLNRLDFLYMPLINAILVKKIGHIVRKGSVLHISYKVHIPYQLTRTLRRWGIQADYLAIGSDKQWSACDYQFPSTGMKRPVNRFDELYFFWTVVARYEVIHSHFALALSNTGWEFKILKQLGRKTIVHFRGCEARDPALNMELHPELNICQECDYQGRICRFTAPRVEQAKRFGTGFFVTTPDLKDFIPRAIHLPFFPPPGNEEVASKPAWTPGQVLRIVHVTNHPGIEGTRHIQKIMDKLAYKGYPIEFRALHGIPHHQTMAELKNADLSIGKMKMGYYANFQIESLSLGIPAITYVRPEFLTRELLDSGFIFSTLDTLEATLEFILHNPWFLAEKKSRAQATVFQLHKEEELVGRLMDMYGWNKTA